MRIGIPRAFYYYTHPELWETFFREIGWTPVVSPPSNAIQLHAASSHTEAEHCLPHKLFDSHVLSLINDVDALFIPRILSMRKGHNCCPRLGALPDATRAEVGGSVEIITIDLNETRRPLRRSLLALAKRYGVSRRLARAAADTAVATMTRHEQAELLARRRPSAARKFLVLGHAYTLKDAFIATPVFGKLDALGVVAERMTFEKRALPDTSIRWCSFNQMYLRLNEIKAEDYSGVIQISTFNCGPDSVMTDRFRRQCRDRKIPYMLLMMDEHTAKAGLDTRLEAFVDSVAWRGRGGTP